MLMLNLAPADAFLSLVNLVEKSLLKSFYTQDASEVSTGLPPYYEAHHILRSCSRSPELYFQVQAYCRIFDTLLADSMAKVYATFSQEVVPPSLYLVPWISTAFIKYLPLDLATRLFDVFLLEGDSFLFRVALVVLQILEPRLFNPVLEDLKSVFAGTDRGAIAVARRQRDATEEECRIEVEEVYQVMGCGEEEIFGRLEKLEWKEETFQRLIERELPDII